MARSSRVRAVERVGGEDREEPPSISIEGIETTQAIQFYRSGSRLDRATTEPDNAIPLIAGKPLVIRVYTDLRVPPALDGKLPLDGVLWYREAGEDGPWRAAWRFPGAVRGKPAAKIDRGRAADTLGFRIGGEEATGRLLVRAEVRADVPGAGKLESAIEKELTFHASRPLRLWLHGIRCRTGGVEYPAPTAAEALETLAFLRRTYPVARIEISYDVIDFEGDLQGSTAAGPSAGWRALLLRLYRLHEAGGRREIHYGLLPRDLEMGPFGGYGSHLGVGASRAGEPTAMAQEIGHALGRKHAPGSGDPEVDPSYPAYGGLPPGSIGEHGFDPSTGHIFPPDAASDFMTNRGDYWVSPYTYRGILKTLLAREDEPGGGGGEATAPGIRAPSLAVEITSPRLPLPPATVAGPAEVRWKASCADPRGITFFLRWSADGGRTWMPIDAGLEYGKVVVDFDGLPGGDDCRLQLIASTHLETETAEIGPVRVARKPRRAMIAGSGGETFAPRGFIELAGCAHSPDGFAPESALIWRSNIQGFLGTGSVLFAAGLLPGEHAISLAAPDGMGGETRAGVIARVPDPVVEEAR